MDGRLRIILLAAALAVSGCRDGQTALMTPPDPAQGGAAGADRAGPAAAAADSTTEAEECDLVEVEAEVDGETRTVHLCRRESESAVRNASGDGAAGGGTTQVCWYWVVEVRIGGILVSRTEELLFCEEIADPGGGGTGGCGGSGGGGGSQTDCTRASLTLICPGSVTRGSRAACEAKIEDDSVDASGVVFEWKSDHAAAWTDSAGTGESSWSGVATDNTEVTVTVSGGGIAETSQNKTISVQARTWPFQQLSAPPQFARIGQIPGLGLYDLPRTPSMVPSASEGSGPWKGRFYMPGPPKASTALWIHPDYSASGPRYSGARGTCQPTSSSLASSASYYEVNHSNACNRLAAMDAFRDDIIVHERDHEAGVNACLSSPKARSMLDAIEKLVGDARQDVTDGAQDLWSIFYRNSLNNSGLRARAFTSGSSFWYQLQFSGWHLGYPGIQGHGNAQHSC